MGIVVRHTNLVVVKNRTHTKSTTLFVLLLGWNGRKIRGAIVAKLIAYIRVGFFITPWHKKTREDSSHVTSLSLCWAYSPLGPHRAQALHGPS